MARVFKVELPERDVQRIGRYVREGSDPHGEKLSKEGKRVLRELTDPAAQCLGEHVVGRFVAFDPVGVHYRNSAGALTQYVDTLVDAVGCPIAYGEVVPDSKKPEGIFHIETPT